ncbi:MAG: biotin/lipoate A/B protein ligase family protein [Candidatus Omnitrophica bacterium]|nr:biotin/lipoate A/B protein ligase family protein [Candidatus Omnitrophota bacterium]
MIWSLIDHNWFDGGWNMAVDEALLGAASESASREPVLRLYGFERPTITAGYGKLDIGRWKENGVAVYRRLTGGGAVFHGSDLTYSVVAPVDIYDSFRSVSSSYKVLHEVIKRAFMEAGYGLDLCGERRLPTDYPDECFRSPVRYDLLYKAKKVAGAAQRRVGGYFLHQGSIDLEPFLRNGSDYPSFFNLMKGFFARSLKSYLGCEIESRGLNISEELKARRLYEDKYSRADWNESWKKSRNSLANCTL